MVNTYIHLFSIDLSLVTFNWFLTAFVDSVPIEVRKILVFTCCFIDLNAKKQRVKSTLSFQIVLRIWDSLLYEGTKVNTAYKMLMI
jgi:hypothetical protein